jgi:hypothetical protein
MEKLTMADFDDYLKDIRRRVKAGELGLSSDVMARLEQDATAAEQARRYAIQVAKLPARHVQVANRILLGTLAPSKAWRDLNATLANSPRASVILCGGTGAGKTTALIGVAIQRINRGERIGYITASRFERAVRSHELMADLEECDLLLLDELHRAGAAKLEGKPGRAGGLPDWILTPLIGLIDFRYHQERQTLTAGTVNLKELGGRIGQEVIERLGVRLGTNEGSLRGKP